MTNKQYQNNKTKTNLNSLKKEISKYRFLAITAHGVGLICILSAGYFFYKDINNQNNSFFTIPLSGLELLSGILANIYGTAFTRYANEKKQILTKKTTNKKTK